MKESKLNLQPTTVALVTKKSRAVVSPRNERKTKLPGKTKENTLVTTARTEDKQKVEGTSQVQASSVKTSSNVSFPCGFTPSQCTLLASRQRISNYIYFKTNDDREEILPTKNHHKKEKPRNFGLKTYNSVQTRGDLHSPTRHQGDAKGVNSPHRLPPMQECKTSINEKTGFTGSFKWKSKEEIAKYLAAHARARLLWLRELEMMNVLTSARGINLSDGGTPENFRVPPQKPVYLFDKKSQAKGSVTNN